MTITPIIINHGSSKGDRPKQSDLEKSLTPGKEMISHHTSISLPPEILNRYGIVPIGEQFNKNPLRILLIPKELYDKAGYPLDNCEENIKVIRGEKLLRDIKSKYNHNHY